MFGEDDFLAAPGLGEAMWGNKIKTLLLLGGVYAAGAFIGKKRSGEALSFAGEKIGNAAAEARRIAAQKMAERHRAELERQAKGSPYRLTQHSSYPYYQR